MCTVAYAICQVIWNQEHKVFSKEPEEGKAEFWKKHGITYMEEPDPELSAQVQAKREIFLIKAQLRETDCAVIKIAAGTATAEEYSAVIAQRENWGARINEVEESLASQ